MEHVDFTLKSSMSRMRGREPAEEDLEGLSVLVPSLLSFIYLVREGIELEEGNNK